MSPGPMSDGEEPEAGDTEAAAPAEPARMYDVLVTEAFGQTVLHPSVDQYIDTIAALKADGYVSVIDLCGADYLTNPNRSLPADIAGERFEIVVNLIAHTPPRRIRVRVQVPASEPTVPTLFDLFSGVEAMEREAYDMFGVVFENHPDPTRILMPHDWDGHPLRKDFGVGAVPVQFKGAPAPR
ncbi:NADH-quinone oxidoreductase subunit C [bacterium]|nr:NADH-quinone oxidoreductase subunit C [Acidimicrobiales bacterium]MDC1301964.1 NADH-quinone oxidoreductase subunit C [bacterium]